MLRSMTGFGRYYIEDGVFTQTWEVRSVNSRHLDLKWRLPPTVRSLEASFEKIARRYASRGRVEISLNIQFSASAENILKFNVEKAGVMLGNLADLAASQGDEYVPDYNRLLGISYLWEEPGLEDCAACRQRRQIGYPPFHALSRLGLCRPAHSTGHDL